MSLSPIMGIVGGLSDLASLFNIANAREIFEDDSISRDEFTEMMREIMANLAAGTENADETDPTDETGETEETGETGENGGTTGTGENGGASETGENGGTGETAEPSRADEMAESLSPVLFGLFDQNRDGVLEGEEVDSMRSILSYFNPDIFRAALEPEPTESENEENGHAALELTPSKF